MRILYFSSYVCSYDLFDLNTLTSETPHLFFMHGSRPDKSLFPSFFLTSEEFLSDFATHPTSKNIIVGATLYSRDHFVKAGGFSSPHGSKWQAGYELIMGPACCGDVVYLNELSILTEIRPANDSFRSEEHTSELKSPMSNSIVGLCLQNKTHEPHLIYQPN